MNGKRRRRRRRRRRREEGEGKIGGAARRVSPC